ncbi:MAG: DUF433 domain-containing protein [Trueperaceae bacterium]
MKPTVKAETSDIRELPTYTIGEASRYARIPAATLRTWVLGRTYATLNGTELSPPIIQPADPVEKLLSFHNLIEAHVLRSLRTKHGVSLTAVRNALSYAEEEFGIERLLLRKELQTAVGDLFLERYGELVNLSKKGQLAMKVLLKQYLLRIERDFAHLPQRFFPVVDAMPAAQQPLIVIDPQISFGQPHVGRTRIRTSAIIDRLEAGESIEYLAEDFGLSVPEVEGALLFETAMAA